MCKVSGGHHWKVSSTATVILTSQSNLQDGLVFCRNKGKTAPVARVGLLPQHDESRSQANATSTDSSKSSGRDPDRRLKKKNKRSNDHSSRNGTRSVDRLSNSTATAAIEVATELTGGPQTVGSDGGSASGGSAATPAGDGGRWVHVPN